MFIDSNVYWICFKTVLSVLPELGCIKGSAFVGISGFYYHASGGLN